MFGTTSANNWTERKLKYSVKDLASEDKIKYMIIDGEHVTWTTVALGFDQKVLQHIYVILQLP